MLSRLLRRSAAVSGRRLGATGATGLAKSAARAAAAAKAAPRRAFSRAAVARAEDPWPDASKGGFAPPAFVNDLTPQNLPGWSDTIAQMHDQSRGSADEPDDFRPQFFNPLTGLVPKPPTPPATKLITWNAFPKAVTVNSGSDEERWQTADSNRYRYQDEYCEWSIKRNGAGKITSVSFTSEGPEYWQYLWQVQPDTVLNLYRKYVSPNVQAGDLTRNGSYNPRNKWNANSSSGAMHLICPPNSLFAEVKLGADASLPRRNGPNGQFITDTQQLIKCAKYGVATRNSDPTIGAGVNTLARAGFMIAFANPVALYMRGIDTTSWVTPDGTSADTFWRIDRGTPGRILRATYEVPQNGKYPYVVGDIQTSPGQTIAYGGQIADFITVSLTGMAAAQNPANIKPRNYCEGSAAAAEVAASAGTRRH